MASFNRVILIGNIVFDFELRYTQGGTAVTEIRMAVNDRRKSQSGDWIDETTFVDVTLWGRTAEIASEYLAKGRQVMIEGRLKQDSWEKDGQKRTKLYVVADKMVMLGSREGGGGGGRPPQRDYDESQFSEPAGVESGGSTPPGPPDEDLPF